MVVCCRSIRIHDTSVKIMTGRSPNTGQHTKHIFFYHFFLKRSGEPRAPKSKHYRRYVLTNRRFCRIGSPSGLGGPLWLFGGLGALRKGSLLKDVSCILRVLKMPLRRFAEEIAKNIVFFEVGRLKTSKTHVFLTIQSAKRRRGILKIRKTLHTSFKSDPFGRAPRPPKSHQGPPRPLGEPMRQNVDSVRTYCV